MHIPHTYIHIPAQNMHIHGLTNNKKKVYVAIGREDSFQVRVLLVSFKAQNLSTWATGLLNSETGSLEDIIEP